MRSHVFKKIQTRIQMPPMTTTSKVQTQAKTLSCKSSDVHKHGEQMHHPREALLKPGLWLVAVTTLQNTTITGLKDNANLLQQARLYNNTLVTLVTFYNRLSEEHGVYNIKCYVPMLLIAPQGFVGHPWTSSLLLPCISPWWSCVYPL